MKKSEFLNELKAHITTVSGWLSDLVSDIEKRGKIITDLRAKRSECIAILVKDLLPSLNDKALAKLEESLPGILCADDINKIRESEIAAIKARCDGNYDPATYNTRMESYQKSQQISKKEAHELADKIINVRQLSGLIDRAYGTNHYEVKFYELQYYADWKRADEIVLELHLGSWDEVLQWYNEIYQKLTTCKALNDHVTSLMADLDKARQQHDEMQKDIANVEAVVLEKARIRICAAIDALKNSPPWISEVRNIDEQSLSNQGELAKLQEQRKLISEELTQLQKLYSEAAKSSKNTVPDKYGEQLRVQRTQCRGGYYRGSSGSSGNNWMLTYLFYDHLFNHFGHGTHQQGEVHYDHTAREHNVTQADQHNVENSRYGS